MRTEPSHEADEAPPHRKSGGPRKGPNFSPRRGGVDFLGRAAAAVLNAHHAPALLSTVRLQIRQQTDEGMRKGSAEKIDQDDVKTETASAGETGEKKERQADKARAAAQDRKGRIGCFPPHRRIFQGQGVRTHPIGHIMALWLSYWPGGPGCRRAKATSGVLQRVDKLSTVPGNRVPGYFVGSVRECFTEPTLFETLLASGTAAWVR